MNNQSRRISIVFLIGLFLFQFPVIVHADEFDLSPTPAPIDYQLPYPGLLPDHPFYFFKQLRDSWGSFFVSGPLHKAEYDLDQADKQVEASLMLVDQKKPDLAQKTLADAIISFDSAIEKATAAKKQGIDISEFTKKLVLANRKHQEVVKGLAKNNPKKFTDLSKKVEEVGKKVKTIQPQK